MPLIGVANVDEGADCLEAYTACNLAEYCNCIYQMPTVLNTREGELYN